MKRQVKDFLNDIIIYAEKAEEIVAKNPEEGLGPMSDGHLALVWCMNVIGEATKNIPDDLRQKNSQIPWREMAGMRDRIAHNYWNTSLQVVRNVVKNRLPQIRHDLKKLIEELNDN